MALSATFTANFSSFYAAVDKAEVKLKDFAGGAAKAGAGLDRMTQQFSGQKVVQEATLMVKAIGGVEGITKLTTKEIARLGATTNEAVEKLKALGKPVEKSLQQVADATRQAKTATTDWMGSLTKIGAAMGIAFSVGAIKNFIGSVFDAASAVKDLSDQWGVSTKAVQQWTAAAKLSGVESETVGRSVQFLTEGLAEGSDAYKDLLKNVGLSYDTLRQMPLEDAYKAVIKAIGGIKDETVQLDIAQGLLGAKSKKLVGAIRDGFMDAAAAQKVMSDETIKRLEAAGDAWEKFKNQVVIFSGEMLAAAMKDGAAAISGWSKFVGDLQATASGAAVGGWTGAVAAHQAYLASLGPPAAGAAAPPGKGAPSRGALLGARPKTTAEIEAESRARTAALAKEQAAADQLEAAYQAWKRGMLGLSDEARRLNENLKRLAHEGYSDVVAKTLTINDELPAFIRQTALGAKELTKMGDEAATAAMSLKAVAEVQKSMSLIKPTEWGKLLAGAIPAAQLAAGVRERADQLAHFDKLQGALRVASTLLADVGRSATGAFRNVMQWVSFGTDAVFQYILATRAAKIANDILAASAAAASLAMAAVTFGISFVVSSIAQDMAAAQRAAEGTREKLKTLREEFGLTTKEIKALQKQIRDATEGGFAGFGKSKLSTIIENLSNVTDAMSDLSGVTAQFGGVVPKALRPMIESFLKMQGLPAQMRDDLAAFAEAPGWQHLQQRAEELGIDLAALGGAFNQKRMASLGFGFFRDIEMFMEQGADLDGVLRGMSDELSRLAGEALKTGTILPKSLEPYMKRLQEMGLLVDENGNAINDLSFADMEDDALKAVVDVLEQIRELLAKALPQAAATFGAAANTHLFQERTGASSTLAGGGWSPAGSGAGGMMTVVVEADGRTLSRIVAPYLPDEVRRLGLARG